MDLYGAARDWRLWIVIGWLEVSQRYRRSIIGPFWITLSLGFVVLGLGIVYSSLFRQNTSEYIPYLAVGLIVWTFLASLMSEGCSSFVASEASIKMLPAPLSVHIYRMVWRNIIILFHNMLVYIFVIIYFQINPGFNVLIMLLRLRLSP